MRQTPSRSPLRLADDEGAEVNMATPNQALAQLSAASQQLQAGRPAQARALLEQVLRAAPRSSDALHLYGVSLRLLGDLDAAEGAVRQAIAVDKRQPAYHAALGDILAQRGAPAKAEASYRAALALNRRFIPAVRQLSRLLTQAGRPEEALQITAPLFSAGPVRDLGLLSAQGDAFFALRRLDDALDVYRQGVQAAPTSGVAEHNVAAALGDLGRFKEAEAAAARAFAKGLDAPETRLVQARALAGQGQFDAAETAFRAVLARQPLNVDAHRDLAQLIWMATEDKDRAVAALDAALRANPGAAALRQVKGKVLTYAGDAAGAEFVLSEAAARHPEDAAILSSASQAAVEVGDPARGLAHALRARALLPPGSLRMETLVCEALLATGDAAAAEATAREVLRRNPHAQEALAYLATAQRMQGDARYRALYDYDAVVKPWTIETPPGWRDLSVYLADLAAALGSQHRAKTHPLDQSLRHGSQLAHILQAEHPAIRAFPKAVDGPIRAHMEALGKGGDPLRIRNTGAYRFQGVWSVKLRPGGGRHVDHIHPEGWLSSACYIDLPPAVQGADRQGWIKFGEPGLPTQPKLGPEHFVRPQPGLLVLFPSYMWHGTVPFQGDGTRLTIAFDLLPQKR